VVELVVLVTGTVVVVVSATVDVDAAVVVVTRRVVVVGGRVVAVVVTGAAVVVGASVVVVAGTPLPVNVLCSWLSPPQTTVTAPDWVPGAAGLKATLIEQGLVTVPGAHVPPVRVNGPDTLTVFRTTAPLVPKVSVCDPLVSPTVVEPKLTVGGVSVGGAAWPNAGPATTRTATAPTRRPRIGGLATAPP
jgi:hypothetical protein